MRPCHIHIPKCAGTSIKQLLYNRYGESNVYVENVWLKAEKELKDPQIVGAYQAFAGHTPLEFYAHLLSNEEKDLFCFAFVRDPVERRQSEYAYIRRTPSHEVYDIVCGESFEQFLASKDRQANEQCRYLCSNGNERTFESVKGMIRLHNEHLIVAPLALASHVLTYLSLCFLWPRQSVLPFMNVSMPREKPEVSPKARHLVAELDEEDYTLYNWLRIKPLDHYRV